MFACSFIPKVWRRRPARPEEFLDVISANHRVPSSERRQVAKASTSKGCATPAITRSGRARQRRARRSVILDVTATLEGRSDAAKVSAVASGYSSAHRRGGIRSEDDAAAATMPRREVRQTRRRDDPTLSTSFETTAAGGDRRDRSEWGDGKALVEVRSGRRVSARTSSGPGNAARGAGE